ncbi:hypothetical protein Vadar_003826 [Vaccinium darrowii]|uniref:Uncharacterized protein n=1 Tax=Vaccinium darrowii TaxID=229202 RepID=A0ACB7X7E4_9ERIC|nr:hypothetical protein Vadar_003826 [Vaccinium darrowii]
MPCTSMSTWDMNLREVGAWAYILFKSQSGALNALKQPYKMIDNALTLLQIGTPQVLVSNLRLKTTAWTLKTFFEKYGKVQGILANESSIIVVFKHRNEARKAVKERCKEAKFGIGGYVQCMAVFLDIS